ncbi:MAG: OpgC domain-containing protein [Pseudotabrizicola sp.]|uniref:OpgC family protein n=1 Tax=Pseudotabrizicola sp. TaxID=2939647 RepID=UPI0027245CE6|nr:OpgC domain-containing protein [Pseudotabrizicola sp.]MDO9640875.1 OpgC domain-containing protein [Pseudotabrizicola sp.]
MRYPVIDGFRGFFLIFMMVVHLNLELDTILGKLNHHYLGWVEDAQGFVFISGFVVGLVYTGIMLRRSELAMQGAIWARIGTIWSHQAGLIFLFLLAALSLPALGVPASVFAPYNAEPIAFTTASLMLVAASKHMGILPMYIWFMMITPLVLRAFASGYAVAVLVSSVLLWMFAQTGLVDLFTLHAQQLLAGTGHPIKLGIFFNVFGWQVLFFGGLWLGFLTATGKLNLLVLKDRPWTVVAIMAAMGFVAFALLDRLVYWNLVSEEFSVRFLAKSSRQDLSPVHVINFGFDLFLVTWLLVAGRESGIRVFFWMSNMVHWVFTRPALVLLGQHSLHVFSFHILVVYVAAVIFDAGPPTELTGSILLILGVLSLWLPAYLNARTQAAKRARPA